MRARSTTEQHRASTPLELFFDLCFVVAISQAASSLHHALAEAHYADALRGYGGVFFAIWWAWMNFTWFASAYDTDDVAFRVFVFVTMTGALILAAGEDESLRGEPPDAEDQTPTPTFLEKLIDQMVRRIPKIEESGLHSIHVGRDGITPDQRAIYGPSGLDGFYLACGLSGTGFKTSPAAGASLVELILDGAPRTLDITPFRFERFAEGKLIEGEYGYGHIWK